MKVFEEHWDFTGLAEHVNYHPDPEGSLAIRVPGINRKEERREGWKAALVWIDEKIDDYSFTYDTNTCCDNSIVSVLKDISIDIEKELEDEK